MKVPKSITITLLFQYLSCTLNHVIKNTLRKYGSRGFYFEEFMGFSCLL